MVFVLVIAGAKIIKKRVLNGNMQAKIHKITIIFLSLCQRNNKSRLGWSRRLPNKNPVSGISSRCR